MSCEVVSSVVVPGVVVSSVTCQVFCVKCGSVECDVPGVAVSGVVSVMTGAAHLNECIFSELVAGQSGSGSQKARVCHFLHRLTNGEDQCCIHKGHNNVSVKVVWATEGKKKKTMPLAYSQACIKPWSHTL